MSPLLFREASKNDLGHVLRLYSQPEFDDGKVLSLTDAERLFQRLAAYPDYRIYVACSDGRVVGTFALLIMDNLGHRGAPSAIVEDVAVDPEWHRRGIGKEMMRYARLMAAQKGCYKLVLSSNLKRNGAHRFYEALGFARHGHSYAVEP